MLIHINGWPGTGKRTIGERLARLLDARFLHNHLILDLIDTCSDRGRRLAYMLRRRSQSRLPDARREAARRVPGHDQCDRGQRGGRMGADC